MAITHVQGNSSAGASLTLTSTFTGNSAGNLIVICCESNSVADTFAVSDSAGNVYVAAFALSIGATSAVQCFYAKSINGFVGTNTVTLTATVNNYHELHIHEYNGCATTSPLGTTLTATGTSAAPATGAMTVNNSSLIVGFFRDSGGSSVAGSGFTSRNPQNSGIMYEDQIVAGSSINPNITCVSSAWIASGVEFTAAGGNGLTALQLHPRQIHGFTQ